MRKVWVLLGLAILLHGCWEVENQLEKKMECLKLRESIEENISSYLRSHLYNRQEIRHEIHYSPKLNTCLCVKVFEHDDEIYFLIFDGLSGEVLHNATSDAEYFNTRIIELKGEK